MSHIFISYSRKDIEFAGKIVKALADNDLDTWIDWESIPKGEDWWREIQSGIEGADAFLFLISPDSVSSEVCGDELEHAVVNGKRILPIIIRDPEMESVPEVLSKLNWIFCRDGQDDFENAIGEIHETIHTDYEWLKFHTELQVKALKWQRSGGEKSLLIRGKELEDAESMLGMKAGLEPDPTDLQREFLVQSRQAVNRQRRQVTIGLSFGVIAMAILAVFAWGQRNSAVASEATAVSEGNAKATALINEEYAVATAQEEKERAEKQAKISRSGELATHAIYSRDENFILSLLLGIEAYQTFDTFQTHRFLFENLIKTNPLLSRYLINHIAIINHTAPVNSITISPDGQMLASGSEDGTVILGNMENGLSVNEHLKEHNDGVTGVAFSPDGKMLASGGKDGSIILWNVGSKQPIRKMSSSDNEDSSITLWDVFSGVPPVPPEEYTLTITSVAFSPDGEVLASGSGDGSIILWDVFSGQPIGTPLEEHNVTVTSVAFSPDGKMLASGSGDGSIILWDVFSRQPIGVPLEEQNASVTGVAFSPDGEMLGSVGSYEMSPGMDEGGNTIILLWDIERGQPIGEPIYTNSASSMAFSPDGEIIASGNNGNIILWSVESGEPIGQSLPTLGHVDWLNSVTFTPDGKSLASSSEDGSIILWEVEPEQPFFQSLIGHTDRVNSVSFSPDGETLASGSADKNIILWNVENYQSIGPPLRGHQRSVNSLSFSPNGEMLATGSEDASIVLWDVESRQPIGEPLIKHTSSISNVAFSPDGKILASSNTGYYITLWDVETREHFGQSLRGEGSIAFSPDGKKLAVVGNNTIILWDVETREPIGYTLQGHSKLGNGAVFNPDGDILASGGSGGIILWDIEGEQPINEPVTEYFGGASCITFSPDWELLASSNGNNIVLWDIETGQPIDPPLTGHKSKVTSITFSPNGKLLASGSEDNTVILWNVDPQSWIKKSCQFTRRNFTHDEWEQYFPGEEYRKTCDQWELEPEPTPTP